MAQEVEGRRPCSRVERKKKDVVVTYSWVGLDRLVRHIAAEHHVSYSHPLHILCPSISATETIYIFALNYSFECV